jgi:peptidoglycan-N-acetylglucosamine deacetylase
MLTRRALLALSAGAIAGLTAQRGIPAAPVGQVAVTIDDLDVNADDTPGLSLERRNSAILATLREARLQAALFVCGMRVDNDAGRRHLQAWSDAGHLIGNHSYSHKNYPGTSFEDFSADVLRGERVIAGLANFRKLFRFPYLKEGRTAAQRDAMRAFLKQHGYRMGYVTIDASDWAIDARLRKRLAADPSADLSAYRDFYLAHIWNRTAFYDALASRLLRRPIQHTLLIHHNLLAGLFLKDLLRMYAMRGWRLIDAATAFGDPIFSKEPNTAPAGESIVWALAKESGKFDGILRYPAEDEVYERERMDKLGL